MRLFTLLPSIVLATLIALPSGAAWAGIDSGGGDSCLQSIPNVKKRLLDSLEAQTQAAFPEFDFATLNFFVKRSTIDVQPQTFDEKGNETDATSIPSTKTIHLSRARWCTQPDAEKTSLLFHEYLVVMEIEKTGEYSVSSRLNYVEAQNKWVCTVALYTRGCLTSSNFDNSYCENGTHLTPRVETVYGSTPDAALSSLNSQVAAYNKKTGASSSYALEPCYEIAQAVDRTFYCAVRPTVANSCALR